ncbi:dedicator of cytokinesis protein 3 isoform X2 [Halyomorpha halys]|uniref:dedicator of cytokinesis protein 3 isoform X2 n=1 Tax=Halyomorpha halys TaxID=286706 RepID=UPI0006D4DCE5
MWVPAKSKRYGVAIYNWRGDVRFGLPLDIGDTVQIFEENSGWYRGYATKNRSIKGIFPASYIHIKPYRLENESNCEPVVPVEDPVVREVTLVLREWNTIWKNLYLVREGYKFSTLSKVMRELIEWRRELCGGTLTQDQMRSLGVIITAKIDWGNRKLGLDLVPRIGGEMVDPCSVSVIELYQVHVQSSENSLNSSSRGTLKRREDKRTLSHHLYLCMRDFGHNVGETTEVYLSLYDAKKSKFISERFLVKISKDGFSNYIEKLNSNCTIFTDLGSADLSKELYIVAHVYRIGRMLHNDSAKKILAAQQASGTFKRPHAVAVLNIGEAVTGTNTDEREFSFKAYQAEDKDFHQLHEFIMRKQSNKYSPLSGQPNYGIVMSLRVLHGDIEKVREENPLLLKNITLTKKLGFPDVIMPGDVRNDLYLTLERGEFERGGKSTGKNIEVTILVLDAEGNPLEGCLWGASGTDGNYIYQSSIMYHQNSPVWCEIICLSVPIEKYQSAHIRLEYRHCSTREKAENKKLIGFSFARLMEASGATLQDGSHELIIYRCEQMSRLHPSHYLFNASSHRQASHLPHKEFLTIRTLLCSTKLTQNVDLLSLLQWKTHPGKISDALTKALHLSGEELVKFLQDVLDALFSMFSTEDGNSTQHSGLVFHVLVSIFSLLNDNKFQHFKPVMDAYIKNHFAAALVYKGLISSVQHCADRVGATDKQEPILKCFRSLESIFKFIVESRLLFSRATHGQYEESFTRDIYSVFASLNKVLTVTSHNIINTQVALVESLPGAYEQVSRVIALQDVAGMVAASLDMLHGRHLAQPLVKSKLIALDSIVQGPLFKAQESRPVLLSTICKHLRSHLSHREELRLCTDILGKLIIFIHQQQRGETVDGKVNNCLHHDIEVVAMSTLDILIQTVLIIIDRSSPVLGSLVACLIGLLQVMSRAHYRRLFCDSKDLLLRLLLVLKDLTKEEVFPKEWAEVRLSANSIILPAIRELPIRINPFDYQVWSNYFNLAVAFLTQPSLQLEKFSEVKRQKILCRYGDMRVRMGFQILEAWSNLGDHKIHFIPSMVGPFLEITLVPEPELRKATLNIFFDMIQCEFNAHGNFKQVESELIDKLDVLISENKGDEEYRQLFNTMEHLSTVLLERVQREDPAWKETGWVFISSVTKLLERLLDYRSVIHGDDNRDKRMSCTVNLLNFYKTEINRTEMYVRYIYKLHALHVSAENYTEAGFTLLLYSDCLTWEKHHAAKLELYHTIVNYFDRAKVWEKGLPLLKELAHVYEERLYDYDKLTEVLKTQARFYQSILHQLRPEPEYFRVGFWGTSFPIFLRNKVFVYRGLEYERIEAFTSRIQTEFPSAAIYNKITPPPYAIKQSETQYIQICNVKPIPESRLPYRKEALGPVPEKISRFYQVNDVRQFQLDRPVHKPPVDKDNEFKSLWLERTTLTTASPLPGILRWSEVVSTVTEEVAPVVFACETVSTVNRELASLIGRYTAEPKLHTNPLSMRLQGVIDAGVMGGIAKYQEAFFSDQFVIENPNSACHTAALARLLQEQVEILESGLNLHGQLAPPDMQPLHQRLLERLAQIKISLASLPPRLLLGTCSLSCSDGREEYTNSSAYCQLANDVYSQPQEVSECSDINEVPTLPLRPKSYAANSIERSSRSLSRSLSQRSTVSAASQCSQEPEEAPPLPPRGSIIDKRNGEVPPAPPKRVIGRKEQEECAARDSGFSERLSSALNFEDWHLPRQPPPVPPKSSESSLHLPMNIPKRVSETSSTPRSDTEDLSPDQN